jgi:hypothetical protein
MIASQIVEVISLIVLEWLNWSSRDLRLGIYSVPPKAVPAAYVRNSYDISGTSTTTSQIVEVITLTLPVCSQQSSWNLVCRYHVTWDHLSGIIINPLITDINIISSQTVEVISLIVLEWLNWSSWDLRLGMYIVLPETI